MQQDIGCDVINKLDQPKSIVVQLNLNLRKSPLVSKYWILGIKGNNNNELANGNNFSKMNSDS